MADEEAAIVTAADDREEVIAKEDVINPVNGPPQEVEDAEALAISKGNVKRVKNTAPGAQAVSGPPQEVDDIMHDPDTNRWLSESSKKHLQQDHHQDHNVAFDMAVEDTTLTWENARAKGLVGAQDTHTTPVVAQPNLEGQLTGSTAPSTLAQPNLEDQLTGSTAPSTLAYTVSDYNSNSNIPPLTTLGRNRRITQDVQPGAVRVDNHDYQSNPEITSSSPTNEAREAVAENLISDNEAGEAAAENLISATLVADDSHDDAPHLVEAEPALEGLAVFIHNKYCKYVAAAVLVSVLAVAIPLGLLLPGDGGTIVVTTSTEEDVFNCGTRSVQQGDYRGTLSVSELGIECQDWDSHFPHAHEHTPENYPNGDLRKNYCRNPCGGCEPRTWCYTTHPDHRWAYCEVPYCGEEEYELKEHCGTAAIGGEDYRGNLSKTATGKKCIPWSYPALPEPNRPENRPNAGLEANYCRNPDSTYPYCYVNDPSVYREFCDTPQCGTQKVENSAYDSDCVNCTKEECGTLRFGQADYRGTIDVSASGLPCKNWADQRDLGTTWPYPEDYLVSNYCRNPHYNDAKNLFAWCFVDSPIKFEACDVPRCEDNFLPRRYCGSKDTDHWDYRGDVRTTISGKQCKWWIIDDAVLERNTPFDRPYDGLVDAYCRNPGGEKAGAWCYVEAAPGEKNFEYCDIPYCSDCGSPSRNLSDYTGTQSQTRTGKTCVPWEDTEEFLIKENNTLKMTIEFGGLDLLYQAGIRSENNLDENYCRNPLPHQRETVFCFIDGEGGWEYCDVPSCNEADMVTSTTCGTPAVQQSDYRGELNVTASGRICELWELQDEYTQALFPNAGLDLNYCRQPESIGRLNAWCFVNATEMTWEYCNVPACEDL